MACPLYHGRAESCLSGMSRVPTLLHPRTLHRKLQTRCRCCPSRGEEVLKVQSPQLKPHFHPVSIETSGSLGPKTCDFFKELGYRLRQATGEINSSSYLLQRLSIAVQRGTWLLSWDLLAILLIWTFSSSFCYVVLLLTLGAHAQRGLQWLSCVCVSVCPLHFGHYE